jgi:hypothetical protein
MIEILVNSLIDCITALVLGKVITIATQRGLKEKPKNRLYQNAEFQFGHFGGGRDEIHNTPLALTGDLGEGLFRAWREFAETRDTRAIEGYVKRAQSDNEITLVVELSRRAEDDVRIQLGRSVEYVVSSVGEIASNEFPHIAKRISDFIQTINTVHKGPAINLVLSMPVVLGFQIGQFVGLSHYNIGLYHFERGRYMKVPPIKRA